MNYEPSATMSGPRIMGSPPSIHGKNTALHGQLASRRRLPHRSQVPSLRVQRHTPSNQRPVGLYRLHPAQLIPGYHSGRPLVYVDTTSPIHSQGLSPLHVPTAGVQLLHSLPTTVLRAATIRCTRHRPTNHTAPGVTYWHSWPPSRLNRGHPKTRLP